MVGMNLQKRGMFGPFHYVLCCRGEDSVDHLFVSCSFSQEVWAEVNMVLKSNLSRKISSFNHGLRSWTQTAGSLKNLTLFIIWNIWCYRNIIIFKIKSYSLYYITSKIIGESRNIHRFILLPGSII